MAGLVQVELPSGQVIWARVSSDGPADAAGGRVLHRLDMDELRATVAGVSETVRSALGQLRPDELNIEFGLELAMKTGKLISVLAEASGTASVKVTLGWQPGTKERVTVAAGADAAPANQ
jgi:Trypsin-co-occurring domain 1